MGARKMQDFDWAAWDKMLEEAHTQEEYHKLIQALPDQAKRITTLLEVGIPPRLVFKIYLRTPALTSETMTGMM